MKPNSLREAGKGKDFPPLLIGAVGISLLLALVSVNYVLVSQQQLWSPNNRAAIGSATQGAVLSNFLERHGVALELLATSPDANAVLTKGSELSHDSHTFAFVERTADAAPILTNINMTQLTGDPIPSLDQKVTHGPVGPAQLVSAPSHDGAQSHFLTRPIMDEGVVIGHAFLPVDFSEVAATWRAKGASVIVLGSDHSVVASSEDIWTQAVPASNLVEAFGNAASLNGESDRKVTDSLGRQIAVNFHPLGIGNLRIYYLSTVGIIDTRIFDLIIVDLLILAVGGLFIVWLMLRRRTRESRQIRQESNDLRELNQKLMEEGSRRQQIEENLQSAEQNLEQASKLAALGQMAAAVSHELNQPLAAMKTYIAGVTLLMRRKRSEEAAVGLQRIDDLIARMAGITKQLKSFSRKSELDFDRVDLRDTVNAVLDLMSSQIGKSNANISTLLPEQAIIVRGDELRIEQILVNLLRNALDAVRLIENPEIEIRVLGFQETGSITIGDNGFGIENAERLFEPFYTTKAPGEGLGLGLAISAGLATEMGGRLIARNRPNGGSEFELHLPITQSNIKAAE